jgi:hypothetical protein
VECITRHIDRCYDIPSLHLLAHNTLYEDLTYHEITISHIDDRELFELICRFRLDHFRQFLRVQSTQNQTGHVLRTSAEMYLYAGVNDILIFELYAAFNLGALRIGLLRLDKMYMHACVCDDS